MDLTPSSIRNALKQNVRTALHAVKVQVGEDLLGPVLRRWLLQRRGPAKRLLRTAATPSPGAVGYLPLRPSVALPRCAPSYSSPSQPSQGYLEAMRASGDDSSGEAGVISAEEVDVSLPIGMHRCRGRVFEQALLADYVLANPKYILDLERLPLRRKERVAGEAVLLTLPWHHNFYHWMIEILPRLALCDELPDLRGLPLVVARSSPRFVKESLALAGYLDRARFLEDGAYRFEKLHLPTRLSLASNPSPLAIDWLRRRFPINPQQNSARRLYISRRDARIRSVTNETEVEAALSGLGFTTVVPSAHTLQQQIELFGHAEIIVGSHGAAFSNLAFARPGTAFIEVFEPGHFNPAYGRIAAINHLKYGFLIGKKSALGFSIDSEELAQLTSEAIQDLSS